MPNAIDTMGKDSGNLSLPFQPPPRPPLLSPPDVKDENDYDDQDTSLQWPHNNYKDAAEEEEEEEAHTPRPGHYDEDDDEEDAFAFSKRSTIVPSRSGCWSSFSWSSLYEKRTESSLSWADDSELEKETTEKVRRLFADIDHVVFGEGEGGGMRKVLREECDIWRQRFPHLRLNGKYIEPKQEPRTRTASVKRRRSLIPRPTSKGTANSRRESSTAVRVVNAEDLLGNVDEDEESVDEIPLVNGDEEILAMDGQPLPDLDSVPTDPSLLDGFSINDKFEAQPSAYFEEKVMAAVARRVWSDLSESSDVASLACMFGERVIEESMEMLSLNSSRESSAAVARYRNHNNNGGGFLSKHGVDAAIESIDENSIFHGGSSSLFHDSFLSTTTAANLDPPISLPNLSHHRPVASSAPPVRDALQQRPISSSQQPKHLRALPNRPHRRANSFRAPKKSKATNAEQMPNESAEVAGKLRTNSRAQTQRGSGLRRLRSQSGSPPLRLQQQQQQLTPRSQQPLSLPPIQGTTITGTTRLNSSNSAKSRSTPVPTSTRIGSSSASVAPPRPPPTPLSPTSMRAFSVSGRRLKSLQVGSGGGPPSSSSGRQQPPLQTESEHPLRASSRLSLNGPVHWDARTSTTRHRN